ncbi:NAD(P)-dependent oxidoreductase [Salipaludibacillus sp. CUR1]|uniref:NAD-dependent epimerase/dehydratase family protein n=1 Tax=Salipaludibacillus sp. CUR1 TaxID=2820003 RepID=UPI001E472D45|nr:NAD(P)-dependent oxidoreductase [Salipaludibacillus sp. CUR1]MCE7791184.1 NAD(P)-dependent oxidoreductase [Salipaludibacillus sp. CUR1]
MSKKTVLVSGANGFLGKALVKQLLESNNYNTIALTSEVKKLQSYFTDHSNLTVLNVSDWKKEINRMTNIDVLINCAFPRASNPRKLAEGLDFTEKLIRDAIDINIDSVINISSQSVYSQKAKSSPDEFAEVAPESLYGMAKYASEKIVASLCDSEINYSNIRIASLTGPDLEARMTNKFVKNALDGEKITVNGRGQKVSYLDVKDAASALMSMVKKDSCEWNTVYNLGNIHYYSVFEIAETVRETAKKYSIADVNIEVYEGNDSFNNLINSDLFYNDFEWKPNYSIPLVVEYLFNYYKNKM